MGSTNRQIIYRLPGRAAHPPDGYPSPYELSIQFKKQMGVAPRQYRIQGRTGDPSKFSPGHV